MTLSICTYYWEVLYMAASDAQKRAIAKYEAEKVDRINCRLPKGIKEKISEKGYTVNAFIIEAVTEKLEREIGTQD